MIKIDVSSETNRTYHYASGATFTIEGPLVVHVLSDDGGDTHRIEASNGRTYRPERGWVAISWEPKTGAQSYVA